MLPKILNGIVKSPLTLIEIYKLQLKNFDSLWYLSFVIVFHVLSLDVLQDVSELLTYMG